MTTVTAPLKTITLAALVPDVVRSCVVLQPSPPPDPGEEPPAPVAGPGIYTPVAPGVTYANLPVAPSIVDTSPDQMIGCIVTVADNPQGRLNALFPSAVDGDGVIDRATNDIWVYDGATWNNVGPTPGPTITATTVIPPWNETLLAVARTRTKLSVNALAYALQLLTEPDPISTKTKLAARVVRPVKIPNASFALSTLTPAISISARVSVPTASLNTAAQTPEIQISTLPGIKIPSVNTTLFVESPTVSTGATIAPQAFNITTTAHIPFIGDLDAAAYVYAVEATDGQMLEPGVRSAINDFIVGCKADAIWSAIKACCILAGARTLAGALTPLVGAAPTNVSNLFTSGDYSRKTGLIGNGSSKHLDTNRAGNADPQNNKHVAVYVSSLPTSSPRPIVGQLRLNTATAGATLIYNTLTRCHDSASTSITAATGLIGMSRSASASYTVRNGGSDSTATQISTTPQSTDIAIYADNTLNAPTYSNARVSFYSIGESLNLALLDARVTQLIADIDAAIP